MLYQEIENLDALTSLEELWLGKNKITELKVCTCPLSTIHLWLVAKRLQNLDHLSNLRILSIQSNRLTSLAGLSSLKNLEEVYVSHNAITSLEGLESNTSLKIIDFSNNQVSKLEHLSTLSNLEELWASNNQLESFDEVERELKGKETLQTVYFEGNPLQRKGPAVYRNKVRLAIPHIMKIDASEFLSSLPWGSLLGDLFADFNSFCASLSNILHINAQYSVNLFFLTAFPQVTGRAYSNASLASARIIIAGTITKPGCLSFGPSNKDSFSNGKTRQQ